MTNQFTNNLHVPQNRRQDDIDIRELLGVMWRGKKLFFAILLLGLILTFALTILIDTKYTAISSVLIEPEKDAYQSTNISNMAKNFAFDTGFILTEIEVIKSRTLAAKVVERLNLKDHPEFKQAAQNNVDILDTTQPFLDGAPPKVVNNSAVITKFLDSLRVNSAPGSSAIRIGYTSKDPEKSALIANTYVDEYIKQRLSTKYDEQIKLTQWLDKRVEALRKQVLKAEMAAEEFRIENNLIIGNRNLLSAEQLAALNEQLIIAQQKYSDIKAELGQVSKKGSKLASDPMTNSVTGNLIKTLNIEKINLDAEISELSSRYGPKHPVMIEKKAEIKAIENRINQQIEKSKSGVKDQLRAELNIAKAQIDEIKSVIKDTTGENNKNTGAMIQLRELEREVTASQNILKNFLEKYKRNIDKDLIQDSGVRIISFANVPMMPSTPDKRLILALGLLTSTIIALAFVFLKEKLYNKFRSPESLENKFGYHCLGSIPYTRSGWNKDLVNQILSNPESPMTEALRNLRLALKGRTSKGAEVPKVISMMSSLKNEGKTTTAILMSALAAKAGERVILIDGNLRNPAIHDMMGENNQNTLVDFLTDQKPLNDIIHKDSDTGLNIIFSSPIPNNAFNLLSLHKLDVLIAALRDNYDLIVIDTPACLTASDARLIEQLSDYSLYNVKYNATRDKTVAQGIKPFLNQGNRDLGFVLTYAK